MPSYALEKINALIDKKLSSLSSPLLGIDKAYSNIPLVNGVEVAIFSMFANNKTGDIVEISALIQVADRNTEVRWRLYRDGVELNPLDLIRTFSASQATDYDTSNLVWIDENTISDSHLYTITAAAEDNGRNVDGYRLLTYKRI